MQKARPAHQAELLPSGHLVASPGPLVRPFETASPPKREGTLGVRPRLPGPTLAEPLLMHSQLSTPTPHSLRECSSEELERCDQRYALPSHRRQGPEGGASGTQDRVYLWAPTRTSARAVEDRRSDQPRGGEGEHGYGDDPSECGADHRDHERLGLRVQPGLEFRLDAQLPVPNGDKARLEGEPERWRW